MSNCLIVGTWGDDGAVLLLDMDCDVQDCDVVIGKAQATLAAFLQVECEEPPRGDYADVAWIERVIQMPKGTDFNEMVVYTERDV